MDDVVARSQRHAALGDPTRLAIVDELATSDRAPVELQRLTGIPSNLLAHHLDVLEQVGLITRSRSSGDGRRRYVHLHRDALDGLIPGRPPSGAAGAVRVHPQLGPLPAGRRPVDRSSPTSPPTAPAPTRPTGSTPAPSPPPAAPASTSAPPDPSCSTTSADRPALVVTVCDRAHEELDPEPAWLHWSIPDPVATPSRAAFDATVAELRSRITGLVAAS